MQQAFGESCQVRQGSICFAASKTTMKPKNLFCLTCVFLFAAVCAAQDLHQHAVQILTGLVKIDTSNPPGNEIQAAQYVKNLLDAQGIRSEIVESAPGRASLIARLKGNSSKKPLLLMGHLDVVGVERSKWTVDPFGAAIKDGYLYGRGAEDDKGMDAANITVFLKLHRDKVPLDRDVIL